MIALLGAIVSIFHFVHQWHESIVNANNLIQDLTVVYNKGRQQAITNELLDIMGGTMA